MITGATTNFKGRYYTDPDDPKRPFPSVTTIKKQINNPGVNGWQIKRVAERAFYEADELARRMESDATDEAVLKWLKKAPYDTAETAADRGTKFHTLAEDYLAGKPKPQDLSPEQDGMYEAMIRFFQNTGACFVHTEMTLLSRKHGYGGTADGLMVLPKYGLVPVIQDWKTGNGPYNNWGIQMSAYAHSDTMLMIPEGEEKVKAFPAPEMRTDLGVVVMLEPTGYRIIDFPNLESQFEEFLAAKRLLDGDQVKAFKEVRIWAEEISRAKSVRRLNAIYDACAARGEWTDDMTAQAVQKKNQLQQQRKDSH